jgi:hypothetical protein
VPGKEDAQILINIQQFCGDTGNDETWLPRKVGRQEPKQQGLRTGYCPEIIHPKETDRTTCRNKDILSADFDLLQNRTVYDHRRKQEIMPLTDLSER